jgi:hypothetical protein
MTLLINSVQTVEGVTVYGDDQSDHRYYLIAEQPRYHFNDDGTASFSFYKYRTPIDLSDGSKGGGFLVFEAELSVPDDKRQVVVAKLQDQLNQRYANTGRPPPQVELGTLTYTRGTTKLNIENMSHDLMQSVYNPGTPSLFGRNIAACTAQLTTLGATFMESALQGQGGFVQLTYDMRFPARLPPLRAHIWFNASKFYSFFQDFQVTTNTQGIFSKIGKWLFGGSGQDEKTVTDTVQEVMSQNQWGGFEVDVGDAHYSDDMVNKIRDWAFQTFSEAVKQMTLDPIAPLTPEQRKPPDDATHFKQFISNFKFASFDQTYTESHVIEFQIVPQGTLEPITNLKDKQGNLLRWENYARTIDLDDPFFRTLDVLVRVNADFKDLPLDSIQVHLDYQQGNTHQVHDIDLRSPDDVQHFKSFIANNSKQYRYFYQVHYKGQDRSFRSAEVQTDQDKLVIDVGAAGILMIDLLPNAVNFDQVAEALVTLQYDSGGGAAGLIERQFIFTKTNQGQVQTVREVLFAPWDKPYRYRVKYLMADGKEYNVDWAESHSPKLYVNSPFHGSRPMSLRAVGDLVNEIQSIFVDVKYTDDGNNYAQTHSVTLSNQKPGDDWTFPVIDERAGKVVYSGTIQYRNGEVETIPEQQATGTTILVGKKIEDIMEIRVLANLIDFTKVNLIEVSLHYQDTANNANLRNDMVFDPNNRQPQTWKVPLKDRNQTKYTWKATYFLADNTTRETSQETTDQLALILRLPAA